jgi:fermentation-respiration switch protein FrsA (DUF1100 family)
VFGSFKLKFQALAGYLWSFAFFFWRKEITKIFKFTLQFPSYDKAPCMARPALFVSGLADTLVPPRMMTILSQRCGSIYKQLLCFETGSHNETWTCPGYYHALNTFLQDLRSRSHGTVAQSAPMPRPPAPDQDTL